MRFNHPRFLAIFFTLFCACARANTFVVTTNADNGPGSLREAITLAAANGISSYDNITFNIADVSEAGRTINLLSALPDLTSKLIIDGSTQPGLKFGVSDAKIKIRHSGAIGIYQAFNLHNAEFIEIYGLYFTNFKYNDGNPTIDVAVLFVPGFVRNIKIGAPGKGNVFYNNGPAIGNRISWNDNPGDRLADVEIKSNFFGLDEDGITINATGVGLVIRSYRNILIGGDTEAEGNYFATISGESNYLLSDTATNNGFLKIINNNFGSRYDKTGSLKCGLTTIEGDHSGSNNIMSDVQITISKNTFNNPAIFFSNTCHGMVELRNIASFITFTGNKIGTLPPSGCQTTGLSIINCENGIIGGDNPEDENIFTQNYAYGLALSGNRNMTVRKNSFYCNSKGIVATSNKVVIPDVKIMNENGVDQVGGTTTPNSNIEVFQTPQCAGCENGRVYMGETTADNNGNWSLTAPFNSAVSARATTTAGVSGEFATPQFTPSTNYRDPVCGLNNGYIIGTQVISGTKYYWIKNNTDTIFNQLDLTNLGPGSYRFYVEQTAYCVKSSNQIFLYDQSPVLGEQNVRVDNPTCGRPNGNIWNISASGIYNKLFWISDTRDTVGRETDLRNVPPGRYKLIILNTTYGCGDSTDFYTLINQSGPTLNTASVQINTATCNNANGSIINITASNVTGTPFIQWVDSLNQAVGNSLDLLNQPAGKYKLKFLDNAGCDTIITSFYVIPSSGKITIDTTGVQISPAGCVVSNGGIDHIGVTGADAFQWQNISTNTAAGNTIPLLHLTAGDYQFTASNSFGCSLTSPVIHVPTGAFTPITVTQSTFHDALCAQNNGSVNVQQFSNDPSYYNFEWIDSTTSQSLGTTTSIQSLGAGTYLLMATDSNGCKKEIFKKRLNAFPKPSFDLTGMQITNDHCSLNEGAINGIHITGLTSTNVNYSWTNVNNTIAGHSINLINAGASQYQLTVIDDGSCQVQSDPITITNDNNGDITPSYTDLIIPRNTTAQLTVNNFHTGIYTLYNDQAGTQVIEQNNTGVFTTPLLNADKDFYIGHSEGSCQSVIVKVKVTVVDKSMFTIPSAFTPNHDGLNDLLPLKIIGYMEVDYFRIYNRNGELVFSTKTINDGWNGKFKGTDQPTGVFVWVALGKDIKGNVISSKGSFLLIR